MRWKIQVQETIIFQNLKRYGLVCVGRNSTEQLFLEFKFKKDDNYQTILDSTEVTWNMFLSHPSMHPLSKLPLHF